MKLLYLSLLFLVAAFTSSGQGSNGLVAHWDFNGTANDVSGNRHDGIIYGAKSVAGYSGKYNTAISFNGKGDHIDVPYDSNLNLDTFSICMLLKVNHSNPAYCQTEVAFCKGAIGGIGSYGIALSDNGFDNDCNTYSPGNMSFYAIAVNNFGSGSDTDRPGFSVTGIDTSSYMCVAGTYDGNVLNIYTNGQISSSIQLANAGYTTVADAIYIGYAGKNPPGSEDYFNGIIDDIRLYNRALSPDEISQYCNSVTNDGGGSKLADASGTGLSVFPNPTNGTFTLRGNLSNTPTANISVVNALGQTVYLDSKDLQNGILNTDITIRGDGGIYYLKVNSGGDNNVIKVNVVR